MDEQALRRISEAVNAFVKSLEHVRREADAEHATLTTMIPFDPDSVERNDDA